MEAVRVYTRYDLPDDKGETRRERNLKFGVDISPEVTIPECGEYIWGLFVKLSNAIHRIDFNGYYYKLPPSEILAWCKLTSFYFTEEEFEIISAMDDAFCDSINNDIKAINNRRAEEKKQEFEKKAKRRR